MSWGNTLQHAVLVLALQATAWVRAAEQSDLERPQAAFEQALVRLRGESDAQEQRLLKGYERDLDRLLELMTQAGDLEKVLVVRREQKRIAAAPGVPAQPPGGFARLDTLWRRYRTEIAELKQKQAQAVRRLADRHDETLVRMQRTLTKRKRIDEALAVRREREKAAEHPDVVAARALLSRPSKDADAAGSPGRGQDTKKDRPPVRLEPVRLEAVRAKHVGNVRMHNDPPRVGVHTVGSGLDWGKVRLPRGRYACALTYSSVGGAAEKKGVVEVTLGESVFKIEAHGTVGWGTPFRTTVGTFKAGVSPVSVSLVLRERELNIANVFDVWHIELVPAGQ